MKHNSLQQKAKTTLTKRSCKKEQTMLGKAAKTFTSKPVLPQTQIQQIAEQHKRLSEQQNQNFFNGKTQFDSVPAADNSTTNSRKEGE